MNATAEGSVTWTRKDEIEFQAAQLLCKTALQKLQLLAEGATAAPPAETSTLRTGKPWLCEHCTSKNPGRTRRCSNCGHNRAVAEKDFKQQRYSTSRIPSGVRVGGDMTGPPKKEFSLWAHYSHRRDEAIKRRDTDELLRIAGTATREHAIYTGQRPGYFQNHEAAVTELIRDCRGMPAIEAARWVGAPVKWVQRQRVLAGYDGEWGEPRRPNERTSRVVELHKQGMKQADIAAEVGITQGRVSQILRDVR